MRSLTITLFICLVHSSTQAEAFIVGQTVVRTTPFQFQAAKRPLAFPNKSFPLSQPTTVLDSRITALNLKISVDDQVEVADAVKLVVEKSLTANGASESASVSSSVTTDSRPTRFSQIQRFTEPLQKAMDDSTGGWALSAANLSPDSEKTAIGRAFLATNLGYGIAGLVLTMSGDLWFGLLTDLAAIASFNYHYQQLLASEPGQDSVRTPDMQLALLVDYVIASVSILTAAVYLWQSAGQADELPLEAIQIAVLSLACLAASWVWEKGQPYMVFHSLWHLFSAYAGYLIGNMHQVTPGL